MDTKFEFNMVKAKLIEARRELLVLLPNQAQNYFLKAFKNQAWDGKAWKEVQRRTEGTSAYKYPKTKGLQRRTSSILVGAGWKIRGGALRRAVSNMARTVETSADRFRMIIDLPYAEIHNEGGVINVGERKTIMSFSNKKRGFVSAKKATHQQKVIIGAHKIEIDKRQFVGQTQTLTDMQKNKIDQIVTKVFKK